MSEKLDKRLTREDYLGLRKNPSNINNAVISGCYLRIDDEVEEDEKDLMENKKIQEKYALALEISSVSHVLDSIFSDSNKKIVHPDEMKEKLFREATNYYDELFKVEFLIRRKGTEEKIIEIR